MVTNAAESRKKTSSRDSEPTNIFLCNCPVENCTQNYSPEMGYFAMENSFKTTVRHRLFQSEAAQERNAGHLRRSSQKT